MNYDLWSQVQNYEGKLAEEKESQLLLNAIPEVEEGLESSDISILSNYKDDGKDGKNELQKLKEELK